MKNIAAEQSLLGGLMLNNEALDRVADIVTAEDFSDVAHQAIYRAILALEKDGQAFDAITVGEWLKAHGEGVDFVYVATMANNTPSSANVRSYAEIVRDKAIERRLLQAAGEIIETVNGEGDTKGKVDKAQTLVSRVAEEKHGTGPVMISTAVNAFVDRLDERVKAGNKMVGLSTGFVDFDRMTLGLVPSDLVIVAGRPSMGKTAFAMNIAEHVGLDLGLPVLVFSMEMDNEQLVTREVSSLGRVPMQSVRSGQMDQEQWGRVTRATARIHASPQILDDTPAQTVLQLRAAARRIHRDRKLALIIVDYLQLMSGEGENRTTVVSSISRGLKALAKELRVPVIALSQLNRSLENRPNKRPHMSDLRESGSIEQDADLIVFLYRDEVYNEDSPDKGIAEVIIGKQRNGPLGTARLTFQGEFCRFDNGAPEAPKNVVPMKKWRGGYSYDE